MSATITRTAITELACPTCDATIGQHCITKSGAKAATHKARQDAFDRVIAAEKAEADRKEREAQAAPLGTTRVSAVVADPEAYTKAQLTAAISLLETSLRKRLAPAVRSKAEHGLTVLRAELADREVARDAAQEATPAPTKKAEALAAVDAALASTYCGMDEAHEAHGWHDEAGNAQRCLGKGAPKPARKPSAAKLRAANAKADAKHGEDTTKCEGCGAPTERVHNDELGGCYCTACVARAAAMPTCPRKHTAEGAIARCRTYYLRNGHFKPTHTKGGAEATEDK